MELIDEVKLYEQLRYEQDGRPKDDLEGLSNDDLKTLLSILKRETSHIEEPNDLKDIISKSVFNKASYPVDNIDDRIKGAIIGRFAGCLLGVPVENYSI